LSAPAGTPEPIIPQLNAHVQSALRDPALQKALANLGSEAAPSSSADMRSMVEREVIRWRGVVKAAGITQP
jgi:tripartite-type tricarboxylate transporter receptor subunit TctC